MCVYMKVCICAHKAQHRSVCVYLCSQVYTRAPCVHSKLQGCVILCFIGVHTGMCVSMFRWDCAHGQMATEAHVCVSVLMVYLCHRHVHTVNKT